MLSVRCYTCNALVGHHQQTYERTRCGMSTTGGLLDQLGVRRMCCRRMLLTHVEIMDDLIAYSNTDRELDQSGTLLRAHVNRERTFTCD